MKKRTLILICLAILVALSALRIYSVNTETANQEQQESHSAMKATHSLDENIDMSGLHKTKSTVPEGVFFAFSNPVIKTEAELMDEYDWQGLPMLDASDKRNKTLFLIVEMKIKNNSEETFRPGWFELEAQSWSTVMDLETLYVVNRTEDPDYFTTDAHSEKTILVPYSLYEPTFSKEQWDNVRELDYYLTFLDYPTKISVGLGQCG